MGGTCGGDDGKYPVEVVMGGICGSGDGGGGDGRYLWRW